MAEENSRQYFPESLINLVLTLEQQERELGVNQTQAIKAAFNARKGNVIVQAVRNGGSFYEQYSSIIEKYKGGVLNAYFYPQEVADLEKCLGVGMTFMNFSHLPVGVASASGLATGLGITGLFYANGLNKNDFNRREFFKIAGIATGVTSGSGLLLGVISSGIYKDRMKEAVNNAQLLDKIYSERIK